MYLPTSEYAFIFVTTISRTANTLGVLLTPTRAPRAIFFLSTVFYIVAIAATFFNSLL